MKKKTKQIIYYSILILAIFSFAIWYLFPYLANKGYTYYTIKGLRPFLEIKPTYIDKLLPPPKEWNEISLDGLLLKLPLSQCRKIRAFENTIIFISDFGIITIYDIAPNPGLIDFIKTAEQKGKEFNYPSIPYPLQIAILKSIPSDVSIFNSRSKNTHASSNQILKAISIPNPGMKEINFVDPNILKATCVKSKKVGSGYEASIVIYNQSETMVFSITLAKYLDKDRFDRDILTILGGVKVPEHPLNIDQVEKDIEAVIEKFNTKDQHPNLSDRD